MNQLTTVGLDLAKDVIAACVFGPFTALLCGTSCPQARGISTMGRAVACMHGCHRRPCGSAHHWGRWFAARGHTVRLIAPQFVAAFRKGGKNDAADAEAVAIAARQPTMRFVPIKTIDQQTILAWHCAREGSEGRTYSAHESCTRSCSQS